MSNKSDVEVKQEKEQEETVMVQVLKNEYKIELKEIKGAYKKIIEIVTLFLQGFPEVDDESNDEYTKLFETVERNFNQIARDVEERMANQILPSFYIDSDFLEDIIYKPFNNLYTAETDLKIVSTELQNDEYRLIKRRMNKCFGDIRAMMTGVKLNTYSKAIGGDYTGFLPKDYRWSDNRRDYLIGNGRLPFGAIKSVRKTIFEMLVEKDGGYVNTNILAKAIGRREDYVKAVVNQLNKKLGIHGLKTLLSIKAMGNHKELSAYRLVPTPKGKQ